MKWNEMKFYKEIESASANPSTLMDFMFTFFDYSLPAEKCMEVYRL